MPQMRALAAAAALLACLGGGGAAAAAGATAEPPLPGPLRIWIDEFFFAEGETALLREAVAARGADGGGGVVLAGETRNRVLQLKSYQRAAAVDVMWTGRQGCYEAFKRRLNASHAVSCVPGTQALSDKARLAASLEAGYGPAAWGVVPRSFRLPAQYSALAAHIKQEHSQGRDGLWVLKEDVHRGKGVGVATPLQALARALQRAKGGGTRHVLAQQFLGDQLLVGGRPFYIRLWAVLLGADPARAYLYDGGVVVFGQQQRPDQAADALLVNLWTQDRAAAAPWSLGQLEAHLAEAAGGDASVPTRLRARLHAAVAATLAAGLPNVRRAAAALPGFQGGSFEVLGVDFLVDASLKPWLVEVNFLPSLARKLVGCGSGVSGGDGPGGGAFAGGDGTGGVGAASAAACQQDNPFDVQKEGFVGALLGLLSHRHRSMPGAEQQAAQLVADASEAAAEGEGALCTPAQQLRQLLALPGEAAEARRLGFVPLTEQMYGALACMAAPRSASSRSDACAVLADLAPSAAPPPPSQQQCSAPGSAAQQLARRLRAWGKLLLLEGASRLPWVINPKAARRAARAVPSLPAPYQLSPSDRRMLAWLQRGGGGLGSVAAVREYCGGAQEGAAAAAEE